MESYHLHIEFMDPAAERMLIASIAYNPTLYFELYDVLSPDVFTDERDMWRQVALAVEAEQPSHVPADWLPAPDPTGHCSPPR